ncbi:Hypothetical predicted protein [Paramuricea clavata]|uniref:Uncharacterized protein n=1 Tax=Paramuricea clavata TaxID=317549 RepID=A0A6S7FV62_PARCT|nr:Hypothetical predicted protein [Paramuricea clavata]
MRPKSSICPKHVVLIKKCWTGFNTVLCKEIPDVSRVGYLPVIDASPTEYSTINAILERSKEITDKLELKYAVLVFDEAVYAKIQQVRWKDKVLRNRFVVCLGEFHTPMTYLSAMSNIFEDGGLKDVFIESGIVKDRSRVFSPENITTDVHPSHQRGKLGSPLDSIERVNYARNRSAYILEMTALENMHPGIRQELLSNFAVQRQDNHEFSAVACDQTMENERWVLSQSERASITRICKDMAGMECKPRTRKDLDDTKWKLHEKSVNDVVNTILSMINLFETR